MDAQYDNDYDGDPENYRPELATLEDIGYFVAMTKDTLVLAACRDASNGTTRYFVNIPRKNVTEIRKITLDAPK